MGVRPVARFSPLSFVLLILAALIVSPPVQADDEAAFAAAVEALDASSFPAKAEAVEALAALGHPRTAVVLNAFAEGALNRHKETGVLVIATRAGNQQALTVAATGEPAGRAVTRDLNRITVNNQIRVQVRGLIAALQLFSPVPAERISAARQAFADANPAATEALERALTRETVSSVIPHLQRALAVAHLSGGGDEAERLAAVETLGGLMQSEARRVLQRAMDSDASAEVREAAEDALKSINRRLAVQDYGQNLAFGLSTGSILLLAAIGLAITFGVMGVINMAHGEMIMLGAYTTFVVQQVFRAAIPPEFFGLYLVAAIPVAFFVTGAVGVAMERSIIRWLYGRPLETLLATWGISLILQQAVRSIFGATNREVANPLWMSGNVELFFGITLTTNRLIILIFSLVVLAALAAYLRYSRMGLNMRAVTQNRRMASAMGINTGRVDALTFGLGSGIAGVAGVALSQVGNVSPNLGQGYIVDSFMVVVFGGVGSLWGTLVGAFSLGIVNKFLEPYAGAMLGKILVLVFIILFIQKRPRGLFALRGRAVDQ